MKRLHVAPLACATCPYRRNTPSGIWDRVEYEKLALYDEPSLHPDGYVPEIATFHCHQENASGIETVSTAYPITPSTAAATIACPLTSPVATPLLTVAISEL